MPFPFSIHYNKRLKAVVTPDKQQQVLAYIKNKILEDKADNIVIGIHSVSYKGSTSNWRGSLFGSVDSGLFTLIREDNISYVKYEICTKSLFIQTSILSVCMGTFMGIGAGLWWFGIFSFLWLFGMNWVIILARHNGTVAYIAIGINELVCGKEPEVPDKEKSEELKSWF